MKIDKILSAFVVFFVIGMNLVAAEEYSEKVYVKTITEYNAEGQIVSTSNIELENEEELYEDMMRDEIAPISNVADTVCVADNQTVPCHATDYKVLVLKYRKESDSSYNVEVALEWLKTPLVTKYDVIAIRWTGAGTITNATGKQIANNKADVNYSYNGTNMVKELNGVGITMNMYDDTDGHIMYLNAYFSGNPGLVTATYQHARNGNITFNMSKSYSFSSSGLGGVLLFDNDTITNYYDGMLGLADVTPYTA